MASRGIWSLLEDFKEGKPCGKHTKAMRYRCRESKLDANITKRVTLDHCYLLKFLPISTALELTKRLSIFAYVVLLHCCLLIPAYDVPMQELKHRMSLSTSLFMIFLSDRCFKDPVDHLGSNFIGRFRAL